MSTKPAPALVAACYRLDHWIQRWADPTDADDRAALAAWCEVLCALTGQPSTPDDEPSGAGGAA
jgi:hypothetical protein